MDSKDMKLTLEPCKSCNSIDLSIKIDNNNLGRKYVICNKCGRKSGGYNRDETAIVMWNCGAPFKEQLYTGLSKYGLHDKFIVDKNYAIEVGNVFRQTDIAFHCRSVSLVRRGICWNKAWWINKIILESYYKYQGDVLIINTNNKKEFRFIL